MATDNFPLTCLVHGHSFYFQDVGPDTEIDSDAYGRSPLPQTNYFVRSIDNKFLYLNGHNQLEAQNLTRSQLCHDDCKFTIQVYHELERGSGRVLKAVMLYAMKNNTYMVVCCRDNCDIYAKEMASLPSRIDETSHEALFFMHLLSQSNAFEFESSTHQSKFLGFNCAAENSSLKKLVLRQKAHDEVDEACTIVMIK